MLDAEERARFLDGAGRPRHPDELPWELLYRIEPDLYDRLVAGERLHEGILEWLPGPVRPRPRGRRRHRPADPRPGGALRSGWWRSSPPPGFGASSSGAWRGAAPTNVTVVPRLLRRAAHRPRPATTWWSAAPPSPSARSTTPTRCLAAMESRCAPGGLLVVDLARRRRLAARPRLRARRVRGPDAGRVRARSRRPSPWRGSSTRSAATRWPRAGSRFVDFTTLGMTAPRDLCWKRRA